MFCDLGRNMRDTWMQTASWIGAGATLTNTIGRLGFGKDERGNMTMVFGFSLLCAVSFVGMTVDYGRGFATKVAVTRALDQAALAAGRKFDAGGAAVATGSPNANSGNTMKDTAAMARMYFYKALPKNISARLTSVKVDAKGSVTDDGRERHEDHVPRRRRHPDPAHREGSGLDGHGHDDDRRAMKLEVAVVMDVTGSMKDNNRLTTAKAAAKKLIDVLLPPGSTSSNARISIVPFSEYVNAGTYAEAATGVAGATTSNYTCTTSQRTCTIASNVKVSGNNIKVWDGNSWENYDNGSSHGNNGFGNGGGDGSPNGFGDEDRSAMSTDRTSSNGNGNGNNDDDDDDDNNNGNNGNGNNGNGNSNSSHSNCTSGSQGHGYNANGYDQDGYDHFGWNSSGHDSNGNSGGFGTHQVCTTQLVQATCQRTSYVNTCMAERMASTGHAYDDASPSTSLFHAFTTTSASGANCTAPERALLPLTTNRTDLYATVDALKPAGYTAGHIGMAWGWYTISDKWSSFWPAASQPAAKDPAKVRKVVIMMTDGAYNTHYDANYASIAEDNGGNNVNAGNGKSRDQAAAICTNMKAAGVEVFTIGLELGSDNVSKAALQACASPLNATIAQHYYDVTSASASQNGLVSTFSDIATRLAASTGTGNQTTRITN